MSSMNRLVKHIEELSKNRKNEVQYAFVAGYYESLLTGLARKFPEVEEYLKDRADLCDRTHTASAA